MNYSTSDLNRKPGNVIAEAMKRPVTITLRKKPCLVLLSIEEYERIIHLSHRQNAYTIETTPPDMLADLKKGLEEYLAEASSA